MGGAYAWLGWTELRQANLAFKLENDVPEPSALLLLGLGLLGLFVVRRPHQS